MQTQAMANHSGRGQVLPGGGISRGTRDSLNQAIGRGDAKAVRRMLQDANVDPNDKLFRDRDGWTPLHKACALGFIDIVNLLLDAGADPSATDGENFSPMHRAVFGGNLDIVASLEAFQPRKSNTYVRPCRYSCHVKCSCTAGNCSADTSRLVAGDCVRITKL